MNQDIVVPDLGASGEISLAAWLKQPGERVEAGEVVAEILTEKVNSEIPAPAAGVLAEQLVAEGDPVTVGQIIARLATDG